MSEANKIKSEKMKEAWRRSAVIADTLGIDGVDKSYILKHIYRRINSKNWFEAFENGDAAVVEAVTEMVQSRIKLEYQYDRIWELEKKQRNLRKLLDRVIREQNNLNLGPMIWALRSYKNPEQALEAFEKSMDVAFGADRHDSDG